MIKRSPLSPANHVAILPALLLPWLLPGAQAEDWPQWRGANRDGTWNETGILQTFPPGGLTIRWRAPVEGGISSPIVARGRVYVTDSALRPPEARERVQCFDAVTGKLLWSHSYDGTYPSWAFEPQNQLGPVATPIFCEGMVYALGWHGRLFCLDAEDGSVVWQKELAKEYPRREMACNPSPLIERDLLIVFLGANPGASLIAFDKDTGKEVWNALDEPPTHSSPIVISAGGKRQLIAWTQGSVTSLAPATGTIHWRLPDNCGPDYAVATPVQSHDLLIISGLALKLAAGKPGASVLWPVARSVSRRVLSNTSTPLLLEAHLYAATSSGELVCMEAATGRRVWATGQVTGLQSGASIHLTPNRDSVWLFTDQGNLIRARLTPQSYVELSRVHLLEPTFNYGGRNVIWSMPAYANQHVFARNNKELICACLAAEVPPSKDERSLRLDQGQSADGAGPGTQ